jgi:hypothetical protein
MGHVMRMEDYRIAKRVAVWNPQGKRRRGRPVITLKNGNRNSTQSRNPKDEYFNRRLCRREKNIWVEENCVFIGKDLYNNKKDKTWKVVIFCDT